MCILAAGRLARVSGRPPVPRPVPLSPPVHVTRAPEHARGPWEAPNSPARPADQRVRPRNEHETIIPDEADRPRGRRRRAQRGAAGGLDREGRVGRRRKRL